MRNEDIIRAWKDEVYRASLDEIPTHPAGMVELDDEDLEAVAGGDVTLSIIITSYIVSFTVKVSAVVSEVIEDLLD